jgi:IPT/TIG domain
MSSRLLLVAVLAVLFLPACGNTLNPFCTSSRPAPLIASLAPSTVAFSDVESGVMLTINGSQFVSSSQVVINGKTLGATIVSSEKLKIVLTTGVISGPGPVTVSVSTPSGNTGDLGCTSGGKSSALVLTVN